jgi:hypothetical protein
MSGEEKLPGHAPGSAMSSTGGMNVFISYRRDDAWDTADRLSEHIVERKPDCNIFLDVASIPFGEKWGEEIEDAIENCHAVLAVIGKDWIVDREGRRRLEDPDDVLRRELEAALEKRLPIIPVLIHEARTPSPVDVPDSLRPLLEFQGINIYRDYWQSAIDALVARLDQIGRRRTDAEVSPNPEPPQPDPHHASEVGETDSSPLEPESSADLPVGIDGGPENVHAGLESSSGVTGRLPADYLLAQRVAEHGGSLNTTVRELLATFGRLRLTNAALGELEGTLDLAGLSSSPKVAQLSLDGLVRITRERDVAEFRLRTRVDAEGTVSMSVAELLQQFHRRRLTDKVRAEINGCLRYVGLLTEPRIWGISKDDTVTFKPAVSASSLSTPNEEPETAATSERVGTRLSPDLTKQTLDAAQVGPVDQNSVPVWPPGYALAQRVEHEGGLLEISARELLALFGRQRLTGAAIGKLEETLSQAGLGCQPRVARLALDGTVRITRDREVPEFRLRSRVDAEGPQSLTASELMECFKRRRLSDAARGEIDASLRYVGLQTDPHMLRLGKHDVVAVSRAAR